MLHPGSISLGCITVDRRNQELMRQYNRMHQLLESEAGSNFLMVTPSSRRQWH
jgi:hypothetical protein